MEDQALYKRFIQDGLIENYNKIKIQTIRKMLSPNDSQKSLGRMEGQKLSP